MSCFEAPIYLGAEGTVLIAPSINPSHLEDYYPIIEKIDEIVSWINFEVIIEAIIMP